MEIQEVKKQVVYTAVFQSKQNAVLDLDDVGRLGNSKLLVHSKRLRLALNYYSIRKRFHDQILIIPKKELPIYYKRYRFHFTKY